MVQQVSQPNGRPASSRGFSPRDFRYSADAAELHGFGAERVLRVVARAFIGTTDRPPFTGARPA